MLTFRRALLPLTLILALAMTACSGSGSSDGGGSGKAREGGSLTFLFPAAPVDLDPSTSQDNNVAMPMWNAWFQYLVKQKTGTSEYEPMLASKWTVSKDQRVYTFTLDPEAQFSDGKPVTADDVVFSLTRNMEPDVSLLNSVSKKIESMSAPDSATVKITLKDGWPHLLADLASPTAAVYSEAAFTDDPKAFFNESPVGTGPFTLTAVVPSSSYTVEKNANYWDPDTAAHLDEVVMKVVTDETARVTAIRGDTAQIAQSPPANQLEALESSGDVQPLTFTAARVDLIALNTTMPPFDNEMVRQAFSLAIDRASIVETGLFGNATVATSFLVPPGTSTFQNPALDLYPMDLEAAQQLIADSGVATPIKVDLEVSTGSAQEAILVSAQDTLTKVGFDVNGIRKDAASVDSDIIGMKYMANTTFWGNVSADPSTQPLFAIDPDYCCEAYFTGFDSPDLTAKTYQAIATADRDKAQVLWDEIQTQVADAAFIVPLYNPKLTYVASSDVTGFEANPFGFYDWATVAFTA